jgi:predicted PurR-regulated permease PerM
MSQYKIASFGMIAFMLLAVMLLHLAPALFVGMLGYLLVMRISVPISRYAPTHLTRPLAAVIFVLALIVLLVFGVIYVTQMLGNQENLAGLASKLAEILVDLRDKLPAALIPYIPESLLELKEILVQSLKEHGQELGNIGKESLHAGAHMLIALAIGLMVSLRDFSPQAQIKPLPAALRERLIKLSQAFESVVFAQARISAINTGLTMVFLFVILPEFDVHLPYSKTLVIITFLAGLLPIVGNLISNSLITLISLGVSFKVAIGALTFLVVVHKLEYFINARIVGDRINAAAWELLLAMLLMESLFGIPGLLLAPIVYAYLKSELTEAGVI